MNIEKKKSLIINLLYYGVIAVIAYLAFKYIAPILLPFIIAFVLVFLLRKPLNALAKKFNLNKSKKLLALIILILFYLVVGGLIVWAVVGLIVCAQSLSVYITQIYDGVILPLFKSISSGELDIIAQLPAEFAGVFEMVVNNISTSLEAILSGLVSILVSFLSNIISSIPNFFISVVLCIISSFFIMADYERITGFMYRVMDEKALGYYNDIRSFLKNKLWVIIISYVKIMSITFVELSIAFVIIGVNNPLLIALAIAVFDILPVFGTGGVMLPWALINLIQGNYMMAIELFVVYIIITIIRNIIEPKIVGAELGLHPVVTLASMLVGVKFFGVIGLFGLPIIMSFIIYQHNRMKESEEIVS